MSTDRSVCRENRVDPGRSSLDGRLDQRADRIGTEPLHEIPLVAQIVILRRTLAEPSDLEIELTAHGRRQMDALYVAPMILNMLFELLDRVTLGGHPRITELHHEPRT